MQLCWLGRLSIAGSALALDLPGSILGHGPIFRVALALFLFNSIRILLYSPLSPLSTPQGKSLPRIVQQQTLQSPRPNAAQLTFDVERQWSCREQHDHWLTSEEGEDESADRL